MSGQISESAKMTLHGNTDGNDREDGVGMNDGVPLATDADQVQEGQPKEYPAGIDPDAGREGHGET